MKRTDWERLISSLPSGLSQVQAAARLRRSAASVRHWIKKLGYKFADGRSSAWTEARRNSRRKLNPAKADWSCSNAVIAKAFGISRERVRQIREAMKIKKVNGRKP